MGEDSGDEGDVWADSSDDGRLDHQELNREAAARHQQFYNAGYREAIEEGKERTLQEGLNKGFREGAAAGFEWGLLRGAVKTLAALDGQAAGTRNLHSQIQALQAAADLAPREAMLGVFRQVLSSPMLHPQAPTQPPTEQPSYSSAAGPHPDSTAPGSCRSADADDGGDEERLAQSFAQLATAAGGAVEPRGSGGGDRHEESRDAASTLPPDAAAMRLPDMRRVQRYLREGLLLMGFDVGVSPPVPTPPPPATQQAAPGAAD